MTDPRDAPTHTPAVVDSTEPMRDQSVHIFRLMSQKFPNVVRFRYPLDMSSPASVSNVKAELGPDAAMPDDENGYYYFGYITDRHGNSVPVLIPEGEVRGAMFAIAVREDAHWARNVAYFPWMMP